jgi:triacylglycerol lipase
VIVARLHTVLTIVVIAVVVAVLAIAVALVLRRPPLPIDAPVVQVEAAAPIEGVEAIPGPAPRNAPLPVVLVHGLFGFDRIGVPGARFDYFRGISAYLSTLGCIAHAVKLPMMSSVPARAKALVAAIDALPHERIDLVAHSLGGLDARYALAHLGLASRVRSLVTIGTPHRGSPIADLFHQGQLDWLRRLVGVLGLPITALEWLSSSALDTFNRDVPDVPGVRYACVVGGLKKSSPIPITLMASHAWLSRVAGPNDGVVPVSSQFWGETLAEIEADHFAQIGWRIGVRKTFDAAGLYAFVVARLGDAPLAMTGS